MHRLVLADDHQLFIEGIRTVLQDINNIEIVAELNNGTDLLGFLSKNSVDLVLLDLNIPGQDGIKCLTAIKQLYPKTKVLILTSYNQQEIVEETKKLNAEGYLLKNSSSEKLKEIVEGVLNGTLHFPAKNHEEEILKKPYFIDDFLKKNQLTKREVDIIKLITNGLGSKQIAATLFLSEFTVNTHRKNIFKKLGVTNVAGLIKFATENGIA